MEVTGTGPRLTVVAAVLLLAAAVPVAASGDDAETDVSTGMDPHPSILIRGDAGFEDPMGGVRAGDGTLQDPYVISDWNILHSKPDAIRIANTQAHVLIENVFIGGGSGDGAALSDCVVKGLSGCSASTGIHLVNATNITLREIWVLRAHTGLLVEFSDTITVERTRLGPSEIVPLGGFSWGVEVVGSSNVSLSNLTVRGTNHPLTLGGSDNVAVTDATLVGTMQTNGNLLGATEDVRFERTQFFGAELTFSATNTDFSAVHSVFDENEKAMWILGDELRGAHICGNEFRNSISVIETISLSGANDVTFVGNSVVNNSQGLLIHGENVNVERNLFQGTHGDLSVGAKVISPGAMVHNNSFVENNFGAVISRDGSDARFNWWGDPSGPSGDGPGTGQPISLRGADVDIDPWLTSAPATGPDAVDCGVPKGPAGAKQGPNLTAELTLEATASVNVNEKLGPVHVHGNATAEAHWSSGPIPIPA